VVDIDTALLLLDKFRPAKYIPYATEHFFGEGAPNRRLPSILDSGFRSPNIIAKTPANAGMSL
jgi:hypothetical protein